MLEPLGKLVLRVAAGGFLLPHGLGKLVGCFGGPGLDGFALELRHFGVPGGLGTAVALASIQTVSGGLVLAGLATRPAAVAAAGFLLTTTWLARPNGWFWMQQGMEYPLLWALAMSSVALLGPGSLSLDRAWEEHRNEGVRRHGDAA